MTRAFPTYAAATAAPAPTVPAPLPVPRPAGRPLTVAVLGDSLSTGFFAKRQSDGWSAITVAGLKAKQVPVSNSRKPGELTIVSQFFDHVPKADVVIVELGTNDYNSSKKPEFTANYETLLSEVRSVSPAAALVCLGPWQGAGRSNKFGTPATTYNRVVRDSCQAQRGRYVPLSPIFDVAQNRGPKGAPTYAGPNDGFHPNDAGHRAIADALLAALNSP